MNRLKKLVILSGKGGTGKTTLSAAFSLLAQNKVMVDCDVDAADLHLLLNHKVETKKEFIGGKKAFIDRELCGECGLCDEHCRFNAIHNFKVDPIACEGCGFCYRICPDNAIKFDYAISGHYFEATINNKAKEFYYAKLLPGEGNSGKLVSELKKIAEENMSAENEWLLIDGPPGIGCPVNASISQMNYALMITEPTLTGIHDLKRIVELSQKFGIPAFIIINKYDLNLSLTSEVEQFAGEINVKVLGRIPFDSNVVKALQQGKSILEFSNSPSAVEINSIWNKLLIEMEGTK